MRVKMLILGLVIIWTVTSIAIIYADTKPLLHGFSYSNGSLYNVDYKINGGCDPDDESFNVTGFCDPDWNDSVNGNICDIWNATDQECESEYVSNSAELK